MNTRHTARPASPGLIACVVAGTFGSVVPLCLGQWTVTNLHPAGAFNSQAAGISGGAGGDQQVGKADMNAAQRACLWTGSAPSLVDLHPAGSAASFALAGTGSAAGGRQVGWAEVGGATHASLWAGSASSWVDLHPGGKISSEVWGAADGVQVGYVVMPSTFLVHASMWNGSAGSWVDLHPQEWYSSYAYGVARTQVVGAYLTSLGSAGACLWRLPDLLFVDLSPGGRASTAYATDGSQQAGSAYTPGPTGVVHAGMWMGSAGSWVELHPAGAFDSEALSIAGGHQAGYARISGIPHASFWSGSAASWEDLHSFLPAAFSSSKATGVWVDASNVYVVGLGSNTVTGRTEALLWTRANGPSCDTDYNQDGGGDNADVTDLANDIASGTQSFPPNTTDFNNDGGGDNADVSALANVIAGGACP